MKKTKLLIATDNFLPRWDGIARFLKEIIPTLTKNYDVTIISPDYGETETNDFKHVKIKLSKRGLGDYKAARFDYRTIKKEVKKNDLVFTQTIGPIGMLTIIAAKKQNKKIASYIHSIEWELVPMSTNNFLLRKLLFPIMKIYTKHIYNRSNLLITPSETLSDILTWRGIRTKKTTATLGVDGNLFKPKNERTAEELKEIQTIKQELGIEYAYIVGNHGRLAHEKDLQTLLRAFKWFNKKHPEAKLLIIGDGLQEIKEKIKQTQNCVLLDSKKDVQKYLNLMDVYVTSSLTETTSLATLEAMASGIPVIATPAGYIKEYIKNKENGLIFKMKNSFELYKKLEQIKKNPALAEKVSTNARKTVTENFQWLQTAKKITEALDTLKNKTTKIIKKNKIIKNEQN